VAGRFRLRPVLLPHRGEARSLAAVMDTVPIVRSPTAEPLALRRFARAPTEEAVRPPARELDLEALAIDVAPAG
jgi:hypothetical protein